MYTVVTLDNELMIPGVKLPEPLTSTDDLNNTGGYPAEVSEHSILGEHSKVIPGSADGRS